MATQAQILANRRNSKKSTGPKKRQGKADVSQNAVKHGLFAHQTVISSENQDDFCKERERILSDLVPESPMESMLAERIVDLSWSLNRVRCIQNQAIDALCARNTSSPLTKLTQSLSFKGKGLPQADSSDPANDLALGLMAIKDFSNSRVLERLLMYERRTESSMYKTIFELKRLQFIRKLQNPDAANQQSEFQSLLGGQV